MKKHSPYVFLFVLVLLFFAFGMLRLNDLSLYTDSTRYLVWGNAVAHAQGFVDTTQPVPEYYVVNAPLYAVLLAPAMIFFPMSLIAAKVWTLCFGALAVMLFYVLLKRSTSAGTALLATAFFAFNPLTLTMFTEVLSEAPFLCLLFSILLLLEKILDSSNSKIATAGFIFFISITILLREVGAALVAAALLVLLLKRKWRTALLSLLTSIMLWGIWSYRNLHVVGIPATSQSANVSYIFQHFVTPPDASLPAEFAQRFLINLQWYKHELLGAIFYLFPATFIVHPTSIFISMASFVSSLRPFFWLGVAPLTLSGIILDFRRPSMASARILFILLYICILLFYPVNDIRFLLPLLPLYIWYCTLAFRKLFGMISFSSPFRHAITGCVFALVLLPNVVSLWEMTRTNLLYALDPLRFSQEDSDWHSEYYSTPWHLLGPWIEQNIPSNTVIATTNKGIVPYAPDDKFLEVSRAVPLPQFEQLLRDNNTEYILAPVIADSIHEHQSKMNESKRFHFEHVFTIGRLALFKITPRVPVHFFHDSTKTITVSTSNTASYYTLARQALLSEQYHQADSLLYLLRLHYKRAAVFTGDLQFQQLVLHTFRLDSARAMHDLHQLYSLATASAFVDPAYIHIHIMNSLLEARRTSSNQQRAMLLYSAGRSCLDMGYAVQAYRLLKESAALCPDYFEGNLWAWHTAMQFGERQQATQYLLHVNAIDPSNAIVQSFHRIAPLIDSLQQKSLPFKRSNYYTSLANEYYSIGLQDDAFDACHAALALDSTNQQAAMILVSLYKQRQAFRAATVNAIRYHVPQ